MWCCHSYIFHILLTNYKKRLQYCDIYFFVVGKKESKLSISHVNFFSLFGWGNKLSHNTLLLQSSRVISKWLTRYAIVIAVTILSICPSGLGLSNVFNAFKMLTMIGCNICNKIVHCFKIISKKKLSAMKYEVLCKI